VERHDHRAAQRGERRQRGQAEVGVDDVELRAARPAADRRDRAQQGARAGREREHLHLDVAAAPQRLDLVAHEDAALGGGVRRPHVRHDERAHRAERTFVTKLPHIRHQHV
jgi:hypothetical protein